MSARLILIVALPVGIVWTIGAGIVSATKTIWLDILVEVEAAQRVWRTKSWEREDWK